MRFYSTIKRATDTCKILLELPIMAIIFDIVKGIFFKFEKKNIFITVKL